MPAWMTTSMSARCASIGIDQNLAQPVGGGTADDEQQAATTTTRRQAVRVAPRRWSSARARLPEDATSATLRDQQQDGGEQIRRGGAEPRCESQAVTAAGR